MAVWHVRLAIGSQRTLQESVASRVAYERKGAKWKGRTETVTYSITVYINVRTVRICYFYHPMNFAAYY